MRAQLSQDEATTFYDELNHHIFELVSSSDVNEKKGGILAIGKSLFQYFIISTKPSSTNVSPSNTRLVFFVYYLVAEASVQIYILYVSKVQVGVQASRSGGQVNCRHLGVLNPEPFRLGYPNH